jgi:hypothetical protein
MMTREGAKGVMEDNNTKAEAWKRRRNRGHDEKLSKDVFESNSTKTEAWKRRRNRKQEDWTSRTGVSAVPTPESPPRPESPPSAGRSLRPSPSDHRRAECDKFLTPDRILSGNKPEYPPGPDTPVCTGRILRLK